MSGLALLVRPLEHSLSEVQAKEETGHPANRSPKTAFKPNALKDADCAQCHTVADNDPATSAEDRYQELYQGLEGLRFHDVALSVLPARIMPHGPSHCEARAA